MEPVVEVSDLEFTLPPVEFKTRYIEEPQGGAEIDTSSFSKNFD